MNRIALSAGALATGIILALAAPLAASAHVTLSANQAAAGSYTLLTFKVPTESATAVTSSITVTLPEDTPFASVSYVPVPGWTTELVSTGDTVSSVVWTAEPGSEIAEGQLQLFPLSVGPVPDTGSIALPVDQGYSDGSVVSWSEEGEDAEHPAPVLYVNDEPAADHHSGGDDHDEAAVEATVQAGPDVLARVLGVLGLVVGAVGIVIGITARRRTSS